ncbi:hypothetical protein [Geobacter sp.]|uniref:hypothetical protein n=1 Tax=Geobacter sp. TaxID=46610 RepID=UPI002618334E|nr:hypothetical protein [Geobacter sp.]
MKESTILIIVIALTLFMTRSVLADSLDKVQFIKISPQDSKAVIKAADGKLRVVKTGDAISETATVTEIAPGRVVVARPVPWTQDKSHAAILS